MAKSIGNLVLKGATGQIGKQIVVRKTKGRTILSSYPTVSQNYTEKQKEHFKKFKEATVYAKTVLKNTEFAEAYKKAALKSESGASAYNMAVKDFLSPSGVEYLDCSQYGGAVGQEITIYDNSMLTVEGIGVKILNPNEIESGKAKLKNGSWVYKTTAENTDLENTTIEVTLTNKLGRLLVERFQL